MAKTLTHLAQSALGLAPVVKPVPRPLFAPQPNPNPADERLSDQPDAGRAIPSPENAMNLWPSKPRIPEMHRRHPVEPDIDTPFEPQRSATMQQSPIPNAPSSPVAVTAERPTLRQVINQMFQPPSSGSRRPTTKPRTPRVESLEAKLGEAKFGEADLRKAGPKESPQRSANKLASAAPMQESVPTSEATSHARPSQTTIPQESIDRSIFRGKDARQTSRPRALDQPSRPEVHVTIGSIEIQAPAQIAPAAPARAPRVPAHMTISEYLNQRRSKRI